MVVAGLDGGGKRRVKDEEEGEETVKCFEPPPPHTLDNFTLPFEVIKHTLVR